MNLELRIKVAEALGWERRTISGKCKNIVGWSNPATGRFSIELPHFDTSLNACHEWWEKDAPDEYWDLLDALTYNDSKGPNFDNPDIRAILRVGRATPAQRCQAFLKWKGVA